MCIADRWPAHAKLTGSTGFLASSIFLTAKGPVVGKAEMLLPVSWKEQPFRFSALADPHQQRLQAAIQRSGRQTGSFV